MADCTKWVLLLAADGVVVLLAIILVRNLHYCTQIMMTILFKPVPPLRVGGRLFAHLS